jgi:Uncharacterised nucleotidyltransferase
MCSSLALANDLPRGQSLPTLRPEIALIMSCAHTQVSRERAAQIQIRLRAELDWQLVVYQARKHGLVPLLYRSLAAVDSDRIPAEVMQQLQQSYRQNTLKNLQFTRELLHVLETLKSAGIEAVPFKGPALAIAAYGDLSLRAFSDLDILVRDADYLTVRTVLAAVGYGVAGESWHFSNQEAEAYWQQQGEYSLVHGEQRIVLDIHKRLIAGFLFELSANFDDFWTRLESISICGQDISTLCPTDLLIYLCIHGTKDFWQRLSWICDVSALLDQYPNLDWESVLQEAKRHGASRMLLLGLALAHSILGTALPLDIHQKIATTPGLDELVVYVSHSIYHDAPERPSGLRLHQAQYRIQAMDRWRDRINHSLQFALQWSLIPLLKCVKPTAKDRQFCSLPSYLHLFYYVLRPLRILKAIAAGGHLASPLPKS